MTDFTKIVRVGNTDSNNLSSCLYTPAKTDVVSATFDYFSLGIGLTAACVAIGALISLILCLCLKKKPQEIQNTIEMGTTGILNENFVTPNTSFSEFDLE